jgi:hypothetical protein
MRIPSQMHVARRLTEETGGVYGVALCESHLEELILAHAPPPPALVRTQEMRVHALRSHSDAPPLCARAG